MDSQRERRMEGAGRGQPEGQEPAGARKENNREIKRNKKRRQVRREMWGMGGGERGGLVRPQV